MPASADKRFEVNGANAAHEFLQSYGLGERDIETVWTAIAPHAAPGIPHYMHPVISLFTARVETGVLGIAFSEFSDAEREAGGHDASTNYPLLNTTRAFAVTKLAEHGEADRIARRQSEELQCRQGRRG